MRFAGNIIGAGNEVSHHQVARKWPDPKLWKPLTSFSRLAWFLGAVEQPAELFAQGSGNHSTAVRGLVADLACTGLRISR